MYWGHVHWCWGHYIEAQTIIHMKTAEILQYIKGTLNYGLFYIIATDIKLHEFNDSDQGGDVIRKVLATLFFFWELLFLVGVNIQLLIFSTCNKTKHAAGTFVYHAIWLNMLLRILKFK